MIIDTQRKGNVSITLNIVIIIHSTVVKNMTHRNIHCLMSRDRNSLHINFDGQFHRGGQVIPALLIDPKVVYYHWFKKSPINDRVKQFYS